MRPAGRGALRDTTLGRNRPSFLRVSFWAHLSSCASPRTLQSFVTRPGPPSVPQPHAAGPGTGFTPLCRGPREDAKAVHGACIPAPPGPQSPSEPPLYLLHTARAAPLSSVERELAFYRKDTASCLCPFKPPRLPHPNLPQINPAQQFAKEDNLICFPLKGTDLHFNAGFLEPRRPLETPKGLRLMV